jgi:hypothetical protein
MFLIPITPREKKIARLISTARTSRLRLLRLKGGPLSDWASEELYLRDVADPRSPRYDGRVAEGLGVAIHSEDYR